jgi:hypothetical protein
LTLLCECRNQQDGGQNGAQRRSPHSSSSDLNGNRSFALSGAV